MSAATAAAQTADNQTVLNYDNSAIHLDRLEVLYLCRRSKVTKQIESGKLPVTTLQSLDKVELDSLITVVSSQARLYSPVGMSQQI